MSASAASASLPAGASLPDCSTCQDQENRPANSFNAASTPQRHCLAASPARGSMGDGQAVAAARLPSFQADEHPTEPAEQAQLTHLAVLIEELHTTLATCPTNSGAPATSGVAAAANLPLAASLPRALTSLRAGLQLAKERQLVQVLDLVPGPCMLSPLRLSSGVAEQPGVSAAATV